jgi:hypothetical protein
VILVIGILVAGVTESRGLITKFRLSSARSLTSSSPVNSMKDLILWLDATSASSVNDSLGDGDLVDKWSNIYLQEYLIYHFVVRLYTYHYHWVLFLDIKHFPNIFSLYIC